MKQMTKAETALHDAIKDIDRFASHNTGHISGSTTGLESTLLDTAKAASVLRAALTQSKQYEPELDAFESAFMSFASVSGSIGFATKIAKLSDEEVDRMLALIDDVREEQEHV